MSSQNNGNNGKDVNVKWTPGEFGDRPENDQAPTFLGSAKEVFGKNGEGQLTKEQRREFAKLEKLVYELKKTDPHLIKAVTSHIEQRLPANSAHKDGMLKGEEIYNAVNEAMDEKWAFKKKVGLEGLDADKNNKVDLEEFRNVLEKYAVDQGIMSTPQVAQARNNSASPAKRQR